MFCESCGKQLSDDASFCSGCGRPTEIVSATQAQLQRQYQQPQYQPQAGGAYNPPGVMPISPGAVKFTLQPGEQLFASQYGSLVNFTLSSGDMFITNMRLVWTKSLERALITARAIAFVQKDLAVIPLEAVTGADGGRVRGNKSGLTVMTNDGKKHQFLVTSKMGYFNKEAQAAKEIMLAVLRNAASVNGGMR